MPPDSIQHTASAQGTQPSAPPPPTSTVVAPPTPATTTKDEDRQEWHPGLVAVAGVLLAFGGGAGYLLYATPPSKGVGSVPLLVACTAILFGSYGLLAVYFRLWTPNPKLYSGRPPIVKSVLVFSALLIILSWMVKGFPNKSDALHKLLREPIATHVRVTRMDFRLQPMGPNTSRLTFEVSYADDHADDHPMVSVYYGKSKTRGPQSAPALRRGIKTATEQSMIREEQLAKGNIPYFAASALQHQTIEGETLTAADVDELRNDTSTFYIVGAIVEKTKDGDLDFAHFCGFTQHGEMTSCPADYEVPE